MFRRFTSGLESLHWRRDARRDSRDRNRSSVPLKGVDLAIGKEDGLGTYQQFIYLPFPQKKGPNWQKEMVVLIQASNRGAVCEHVCSWHLVDGKPAQNPKNILIQTLFHHYIFEESRGRRRVGGVGGGAQVTSGFVRPPPPHTHTFGQTKCSYFTFFSYFVCSITLLLFIDIFQALIIANLKI